MVMLKSIVSGSFLYNRAGEILQVLRPDNRQTTYERDAFGRINRADYSDGSWEAFSYDKGGLTLRSYLCEQPYCFPTRRFGVCHLRATAPQRGDIRGWHTDRVRVQPLWRTHLARKLLGSRANGRLQRHRLA
ncbi:MAG: RHS repeat protein [Prevotella pallens]|nr:RHS repeat protein [Prevotella pallens]